MKFLFVFTLLFSMTAFGNFERMPQNIKLPTQFMLEHQKVSAPATASSAAAIMAATLGSSVPVTVSSFAAQPDVARNLVITPGATTADVKAGSVVVTGTNIRGQVISESFVFVDNQSSAVTGNKAFKSVTSVLIPVQDSPYGATYSIGTGTKLGLNKCMDAAGYIIKSLVDGADITGVTIAASATDISSNTIIPNPAPNGSRVFDFMFVQNWRCD